MAISSPAEWLLQQRDCHASLAMTVRAKLGTHEVVKVVGRRQTAQGGTGQPRCFISILAGSARQLLAAVRSHWGIENSLHWILDVTFREGRCRVRKDHGPQNINTQQQIGHNLLKHDKTLRGGIQGKRRNAGWDEDYLRKVLLG